MFVCTSCNKELEDGTLVCPDCGNHVAVNAKKAKLENLKLNTKSITSSSFGGVLFLIISIAMSIISLSGLIDAFTVLGAGGALNALSGILSLALCVFPVLTTVGCWMCFAGAKTNTGIKKPGFLRIYPKYQHVVGIIGIVGVSILAGLVAILLIVLIAVGNEFYYELMSAAREMGVSEYLAYLDVFSGAFAVAAFIIILVMAGIIVYMVFNVRCYKKIANQLSILADSAESGVYNGAVKAPFVSLFIFGTIGALGSLASFGLSFWAGLTGLAGAAYLIVHALFFKEIAKKQKENAALLEIARAELDETIKVTEAEIALAKKQQQDTEAEAMHKMQEQNQLFQQMFNNMMAQQAAAAAATANNSADGESNQQ